MKFEGPWKSILVRGGKETRKNSIFMGEGMRACRSQ
jgi:hypothetical protein